MNNNNKYHYVICGFSGVGKSTAEQLHKNVEDWESSAFRNTVTVNLKDMGKREFPQNYIDALVENMGKSYRKIYLLSCHQNVRDELKKRGIPYIIVMPEIFHKNEYIKRWFRRGSDMDFIYSMNENWDEMIRSCLQDDAPKIFLDEYQYLNDVLPL